MSRTISSRLTRWYVGSFFVFLGLAFSITWIVVDQVFDKLVEQELIEDFTEFQLIYNNDGVPGILEEIVREDGEGYDSSEFIRLISPQGDTIGKTDMSRFEEMKIVERPALNNLGYALGKNDYTISDESADQFTTLNFQEIYGRLENGMTIHIGEYPDGNNTTLVILRNSFILILLFSIPLAILISRKSIRSSVSGITNITATAEKIRQGHLNERVQTNAVDIEISTLENTFNTMLDRIKELVTEIREMTDNIAHDLKSPLARIRFMSELSLSKTLNKEERDESAAQTIDECDRLIKMIDMALDVAEAQAGINSHKDSEMDMSSLVTAGIELFEPVAELNNIKLTSNVKPGCRYKGGLESIQRTVSNLIDNAIKYSDAGGNSYHQSGI